MKISEAMADYFHYITAVDQKSMKTVESYKNECAHYLKALNEQGIEDMEAIKPFSSLLMPPQRLCLIIH